MTYLELVNKVLTRLREDTVLTVNQNNYSALVGEFVNDAKEFVENAWDWSVYYKQITENTSNGVSTVDLTGTNDYTTIESALLYKSGGITDPLIYRDRAWMTDAAYQALGSNARGQPKYWTVFRLDNGELEILLHPRPDATYNLIFNVYDRPDTLVDDSDSITVPSKPVIMLATAFASRERGETGGISSQELFSIADKALSDAIAVDANRAPEKLLYRAV